MDERIKNALSAANYRITISNQIEALKLKTNNLLIHAENGGIFTADQKLISFLSVLVEKNYQESVIIDDNGNPILIEDTQAFLDKILDVYSKATINFYNEYQKLKQTRNLNKLFPNEE